MTLANNRRSQLVFAGVTAACAIAFGAPSANAGIAPVLNFSINVSGGSGFMFSDAYQVPDLFALGGGQFAYGIDPIDISEFFFNPTPITVASGAPTNPPAGILTGFAFNNTTNENLEVVITLVLNTSFASGAGSLPWETNLALAVNSGTTVSTLGVGQAMWSAAIDGSQVGSLFPHPSFLSGILGAADEVQNATGSDPAPLSTMSIQIAFDITPGGQTSFNGNFLMIPAPGALALLGLGGIMGFGRRRR